MDLIFKMLFDSTYRFITLHMSTFWTRICGAIHTELKTSKRNTASGLLVVKLSALHMPGLLSEVKRFPNPNSQTFH